jgi:hypothetical protein
MITLKEAAGMLAGATINSSGCVVVCIFYIVIVAGEGITAEPGETSNRTVYFVIFW